MGTGASTQGLNTNSIDNDNNIIDNNNSNTVFEKSPFDDEPSFTNSGVVVDDIINNDNGNSNKKSVSPTKLKRMALGQQSYMDHQRDYDQTLNTIDCNKTATVDWSGPVNSPQSAVSARSNASSTAPRPMIGSNRTPPHLMQGNQAKFNSSGRSPPTVIGQSNMKRPGNASNEKSTPRSHLQTAGALALSNGANTSMSPTAPHLLHGTPAVRMRSPPSTIPGGVGANADGLSANAAMAIMNNQRMGGRINNSQSDVQSPNSAPQHVSMHGATSTLGPRGRVGPRGPIMSPYDTDKRNVSSSGGNGALSYTPQNRTIGTSSRTPDSPMDQSTAMNSSVGQIGPSPNGIKVRPFPRKGDNNRNNADKIQTQTQQIYTAPTASGKYSENGDDDMIADFSMLDSEKLGGDRAGITHEHKRPDNIPILAISDSSLPDVIHSLPSNNKLGTNSKSNAQPDFYAEVQQIEKQRIAAIVPRPSSTLPTTTSTSSNNLASNSGSNKAYRPPTVSVPVVGMVVQNSSIAGIDGSERQNNSDTSNYLNSNSASTHSIHTNSLENRGISSENYQNGPSHSINNSVSNVSAVSTNSPSPMSNRPPQKAPLPQGMPAAAPIVKETKDVKRNRAQLPTTMTHARPTTGDWLNKRYIVNNYILLDTLGQGSYAEVRLCKERTEDKLFAIKIISKDFLKKKKTGKTTETYFEDIKREIAIMKKLLHPNILRLFEVLDDPKVNKMYLVLEYMKMGDLIKVLKDRGEGAGAVKDPNNPEGFVPLNDIELWHIFRQVVFGIKYLHRQNIVHGDIKPQNLLLREDGLVKIADFGISQMISDGEKLSNAAGTPAFMSPELCEGKSTFSGQLADVWAIGATMFMLKFGRPPFIAKSIINLYAKIVNDPLVFPEPVDPGLQNLFELMLEKDPNKRVTLDQIMKHPWMMTMPIVPISVNNTPTNTQLNSKQINSNLKDSTSNIKESDSSSTKNDFNIAVNTLKATGKLKSMSFRPPDSYAAEEAAAMEQPVQTIDQKEVYASIGGIQKRNKKSKLEQQASRIEENRVNDDDDDDDDSSSEEEEVSSFLTKTIIDPKAATASSNEVSTTAKNPAHVTTDIMDTGWGADVFGMVEDDESDADGDSVDDDSENEKEEKPSLGVQKAHNESGSSSGSGSGLKHNEMSQEEEARRSMQFQKKVNAKASSSNMRYTASSANKSSTNTHQNRSKHRKDGNSKDTATPNEPRSPTRPAPSSDPNARKVSFRGPQPLSPSQESSSSMLLSAANSERSLTPSSRSASRLHSGALHSVNSDRRFNQSRDSMMSRGLSRDDLEDETTDQLTMEDFSRMMDTLAMQPGVIDEENEADEEMHRKAAELSIQGYCAELHNNNNGVAAAFNSERGNRHSQEDRCVLIPNVADMKDLDRSDTKRIDQLQKFTIACLFDGHNGWRCSHYLSQNFPKMLIMHPNFLDKQCERAISETCEAIDNQVCDYLNEEMDGAGSTGAIAIYDGRKHIFTVGNVGDSMCVLSRGGKAVMLNRMHRLDNEEERERVKRAGGTIINNRVNGVLAISRAFGDTQFKAGFDINSNKKSSSGMSSPPRTTRSGLVISKPDVHAELITPKTEFAILATDGLWDVMSAQMAVTFVRQKLHKHRDLEAATRELCKEALQRGSVDNVTIVIISFHYSNDNNSEKYNADQQNKLGTGTITAVATSKRK